MKYKPLLFLSTLNLTLGGSLYTRDAFGVPTPEEEAKVLVKQLKGISDEDWKTIAGTHATENYGIIQGDTLYDISKRLFGDPKYWPKIWALNNQSIRNPHLILPGNSIAFSPGSGSSLPAVAIQERANQSPAAVNANGTPAAAAAAPGGAAPDGTQAAAADTQQQTTPGRSQEWRKLPKQSWENYNFGLPSNVDSLGFDKTSKIKFHGPTGYEAQAIPSSEKLRSLGEVVGSRSPSEYFGLRETVYIRSKENLQVNDVYALTEDPVTLKSPKSDRVGYSYWIIGKVKIIGVRGTLYVGEIGFSRDFVKRGSHLIPYPARIPEMDPVPGPRPLTGVLLIDHRFSTVTTAQYKEAFIDRGSEDGLKPGMILRAYEHDDPSTGKKVTDTDFVIDGDLIVTRTSENYSSLQVVRSINPLTENTKLTLLTDVSDVLKNLGFNQNNNSKDNIDDIDKLDKDEPIGQGDKKELKQLENFKGGDAEGGPPAPPEPPGNPMAPPTGSSSADQAMPPPPGADGAPPPPDGAPPPPGGEGAPAAEAAPAADGGLPPAPATDAASAAPPDAALPATPPPGDMPPPPVSEDAPAAPADGTPLQTDAKTTNAAPAAPPAPANDVAPNTDAMNVPAALPPPPVQAPAVPAAATSAPPPAAASAPPASAPAARAAAPKAAEVAPSLEPPLPAAQPPAASAAAPPPPMQGIGKESDPLPPPPPTE